MKNLNENSLEYWENLLKSEWLWDIDKELWIKEQKNIKNTKKETRKKIDLVFNPDNYIKNFEKENPDLKINIDFENSEIEILDKNWLAIWHIWPGFVPFEWFENEPHLYFEIDEKYRWKDFWKFLFSIYKHFSKKDKNFILPENEYVSSPSNLNFFIKNEIFSIVEVYDKDEKIFRELDEQDLKKYLKNKNEYFLDNFWERIMLRLSN